MPNKAHAAPCCVATEARKWKAAHDEMVARNTLLRDRPDLPLERTEAYAKLMKRVSRMESELSAWREFHDAIAGGEISIEKLRTGDWPREVRSAALTVAALQSRLVALLASIRASAKYPENVSLAVIDDALETMELHGMHDEPAYRTLKTMHAALTTGEKR